MKENELMLGDYITFKDSVETDKTPLPIKVLGIGYVDVGIENGALVEIERDKTCDIIEINDECVGIQLTREILKSNGFGYVECDGELLHYHPGEPYYCADVDFHIGTDRKGHFWLNYHDNSIYGLRYVHELQHALRLLRTGREIEL